MSDVHPTPRTYAWTAVALFALLAATVGTSYLPLARLGLAVALTIALTKATLVGLYFMHVRYGPPIVRIFATAGILWLAILFWLTLNDYLTRG